MAARTEEAKLVQVGGHKFIVDGFCFQREDVTDYILTHFHGDHTVGLTRSFAAGLVYCTKVTAGLVTELIGVDPVRVRGLDLGDTLEVPGAGGARLTLLDADHCPGSAVVALEAREGNRLVLHTGDCRSSARMRQGLQDWLGGRQVDELFLDTTYCNKKWTFPAQEVACEWLREIARLELERQPKTLFIVGSYQIGKERAVRAIAEVTNSSTYVEHRRWRVLQLADWGDERLPSGKPLWSIDKEGCQVWMNALGGLGHDTLQHFLKSTKGKFEAVVAFRPTGWAWAPKKMAAEGSDGCRVWAENDGATRIYGVPYSEHSSYDELQALADMLRPKKIVPTVNSETQAGKERMISPFLGVVDLRADKERMDHYIFGGEGSSGSASSSAAAAAETIDVLAMSAGGRAAFGGDALGGTRCVAQPAAVRSGRGCGCCAWGPVPRATPQRPHRWGSGILRATPPGLLDLDADTGGESTTGTLGAWRAAASQVPPSPAAFVDASADEASEAGSSDKSEDCEADASPAAAADGAAVSASADAARAAVAGSSADGADVGSAGAADDLRCVDLAQQQRLLRYYESLARTNSAKTTAMQAKAKPKIDKKQRAAARKAAATGPLARLLGVTSDAKAAGAKRKKRDDPHRAASGRGGKTRKPDAAATAQDPKPSNERRPTRFIPRPNARVQERIERAFGHRLYFLSRQPAEDDKGMHIDVLGSTGNVYTVKLLPTGNECSCLDFAKATGVCKHVLFVMLRILKLPRDDHRVWQTSLVPSELLPLVERLRDESKALGVRADAAVLRGYEAAKGSALKVERKPLPEDCPICFEEMREGHDGCGSQDTDAVAFCHTCGHNIHRDCRRRWASVSKGGDLCPLCRSPWAGAPTAGAGAAAGEPVNLAAYSAEHQGVSLAELYPESHQWMARRERR